jgi:hypothetical protein
MKISRELTLVMGNHFEVNDINHSDTDAPDFLKSLALHPGTSANTISQIFVIAFTLQMTV